MYRRAAGILLAINLVDFFFMLLHAIEKRMVA